MRDSKFARYGPSPRYGIPPAGLCISSFAIIRKGNRYLVGRARRHPKWEREWAPNFSVYTKKDLDEEFRSWRLPCTYLKTGEHPDHALHRVMKDQLGIGKYSIWKSKVYTFYDPISWYPGKRHYDICFAYEIKTKEALSPRPWFAQLRYAKRNELRAGNFGSAIGDLTRRLGLVPR